MPRIVIRNNFFLSRMPHFSFTSVQVVCNCTHFSCVSHTESLPTGQYISLYGNFEWIHHHPMQTFQKEFTSYKDTLGIGISASCICEKRAFGTHLYFRRPFNYNSANKLYSLSNNKLVDKLLHSFFCGVTNQNRQMCEITILSKYVFVLVHLYNIALKDIPLLKLYKTILLYVETPHLQISLKV